MILDLGYYISSNKFIGCAASYIIDSAYMNKGLNFTALIKKFQYNSKEGLKINISIIGTGYVGLVTGVCLSDVSNKVICFDIDENKISLLKNGSVSIYEPGLDLKLNKNISTGNLTFSCDFKKTCMSEIIFIAVGTPSGSDGAADLSSIYKVAKKIGKQIANNKIIVVKSTVPVGNTHKVRDIILSEIEMRGVDIDVAVINNPEFLREGKAVSDFMSPDRIIVGSDVDNINKTIKNLYHPFSIKKDKLIFMDVLSSEMTKYASNSMLANRISFMNEISRICEAVGANVNNVRNGMGADTRIGYKYLYPSVGYGGSCFPKDLKALDKLSSDLGYKPQLVRSTISVNSNQVKHFIIGLLIFLKK